MSSSLRYWLAGIVPIEGSRADHLFKLGAMPTPVLRYGHENLRTNMAKAGYRRGHGTLHFG